MKNSTPTFADSVSVDVKSHSLNMKLAFGGNKMTRIDREINIENIADSVAQKYSNEVAASVFRRYDVTCFEDLSPDN